MSQIIWLVEKELTVYFGPTENALHKVVSKLDEEDATARYQLEADDHRIQSTVPSIIQNGGEERKIISWAPNDPDNPYNWSPVRRHSSHIPFPLEERLTKS